jgi:hypothetical protein
MDRRIRCEHRSARAAGVAPLHANLAARVRLAASPPAAGQLMHIRVAGWRSAARSPPGHRISRGMIAAPGAPHQRASAAGPEGLNLARSPQLFFAKVPRTAAEEDIIALFGQYGDVCNVNLFRAFLGAPTSKVRTCRRAVCGAAQGPGRRRPGLELARPPAAHPAAGAVPPLSLIPPRRAAACSR